MMSATNRVAGETKTEVIEARDALSWTVASYQWRTPSDFIGSSFARQSASLAVVNMRQVEVHDGKDIIVERKPSGVR